MMSTKKLNAMATYAAACAILHQSVGQIVGTGSVCDGHCRSLPCNAASEESFGNSAQAAEPSILPDRAANLIGLSRRVARQVQPISDGHGLVFGELLEARSVSRWGRG
jgi:hypothetical protein